MKPIFLFIVVYCISVESALTSMENSDIVTFVNQPYNGVDGEYSFAYETRDHQSRKETGKIVTAADKRTILRVTGSYTFFDSDGKERFFEYEADENGYRQTEQIIKIRILEISQNVIKSLVG